MNTRLGKSFGLAFVLAVGILAVMFALGTFNAPKAGADVTTPGIGFTTTPDAPGPGASIGMELVFQLNRDADAFDEITIALKDFGLPSSIAERSVSVRQSNAGGAAAAVDLDGSNLIVELPDINGTGAGNEGLGISRGIDITILIRKNAGITAPTAAGDYPVTVAHNDQTDAVELGKVMISRTVSVDPDEGGGGTEVTVNGKAFADGTGTLFSGPVGATPSALKDVTVTDGAFETTVDAADLEKADDGVSVIEFRDSNGDKASANFKVTGTTTLGSDSVGKGKSLTISISDWIETEPTLVKIDGVDLQTRNEAGATAPVVLDVDRAATFYVTVSGRVGLGTKTVVLFGNDDKNTPETTDDVANGKRLDSASVEITAVDLTVSPSTAVVGREVTITGSGFTGSVASIEVGEATVCDSTENNITDCNIETASGGRVVAAFNIPDDAALADAGDYTITVTDSGDRIGTGTVTIPERTLTVDPAESRIGTTINISGAGWPTGTVANLVGIYYDGIQYATAISAADGRWSASISVPTAANVGETHKVEAKATVGGGDTKNVNQEADHKTPDAVVTLSSAQAQRGTTITVSGDNFNVFRPVMIEIDGSNVAPSATTTDGTGSFSAEVRVPGLSLGNKNLKVTVSDVPVVEFLEIVATPVVTSKASADVFEPLVTAGVLTVVWSFDNTTKAWSFYDPRPEVAAAVDLTVVNTGDNVWIQVTADMDFQGETLTAGWNLHTLN